MGLKRRIDLIKEFVQLLHTKYVTGFNAPGRPLLDPETLDWLTGRIEADELLSGIRMWRHNRSCQRPRSATVSVESDAAYAAVVRGALRHPELTKIVTPHMGITGPWGMPIFFASRKGPRYINAPFSGICTQFPDLIFVDGRYRVACTLESASRAARAGFTSKLLFDDYQPRDQYRVVEKYLGAPERIGRAALFLVGAHEIPREVICEHAADPR